MVSYSSPQPKPLFGVGCRRVSGSDTGRGPNLESLFEVGFIVAAAHSRSRFLGSFLWGEMDESDMQYAVPGSV